MPSKARAVLEQLESAGDGAVGNSNLNFPEEFHRETENQLKNFPYEIEAHANELIEPSMAERLDGLQDRNVPPRGSSEMSRRMRGKSTQYFLKKSISSVGDRIIDNQEQPEGVITESSSDDEVNYQNLNLANQEMKGQTMADRFQEALAATSFSNEGALFMAVKLSGIGLFGKLQKVMQNEKERDADFLKKLQMGDVPNDESQSIVVKILSRYLEAKLIVCHCSFHKNLEDSQLPEGALTVLDRGRKGTVIFSPRVCSDVELEIGNLIRIHPPWKEVQVMGNNEGIILSTYFSHIFM
ncbi:hypothetical protein JCGZ_13884 [Jatropha curcas]|uniref:Uncharacterized protein n=2 Tax=Jatropha curcas TaxID=180498 RepID=A0A067JZ79_JATCU|nr:hypothetical protein JCGZ_13884 [Jatropha curcas]